MILVDTNVFIDYWNNPIQSWTNVFQKNEIAVCGVIKTELLRGCHSKKEFEKIQNALDCFEYLSFDEKDWIEVSKIFIELKRCGLSVPFQDGIIAYIAKKYKCKIWTNDSHFKLIKNIIPEINLLRVKL